MLDLEILSVKGGGAGRDGCSSTWFCQIRHPRALSGKTEDEEGSDGRGYMVIVHAAVVVVAMHVAMVGGGGDCCCCCPVCGRGVEDGGCHVMGTTREGCGASFAC